MAGCGGAEMTTGWFILAALFLPLFPLGMAFTSLFGLLRNSWLRVILLLAWPQVGLHFLLLAGSPPPQWLVVWAMLSSLFYAWRALALREAGQWTAFLALSTWPLIWAVPVPVQTTALQVLGLSLPLAVMAIMVGGVERRFGAAHIALDLRLASVAPRLAGLFTIAVFAAIAMPLSPSFFALLALVTAQVPLSLPTVLAVLGAWLLWSWSGMRLVQGMIAGPVPGTEQRDIPVWLTAIGTMLLVSLALAGPLLGRMML